MPTVRWAESGLKLEGSVVLREFRSLRWRQTPHPIGSRALGKLVHSPRGTRVGVDPLFWKLQSLTRVYGSPLTDSRQIYCKDRLVTCHRARSKRDQRQPQPCYVLTARKSKNDECSLLVTKGRHCNSAHSWSRRPLVGGKAGALEF
jgi:hypothetical protein